MDLDRVRDTLGRPELQWLLEKLTRRLELGKPLTGSLTVRYPTADQRSALGKLMGKPIRQSATVTIRLADIEQLLQRAGICAGLREAVEALKGPVINRREEALAASNAWSRIFREVENSAEFRPSMRPWIENLERTGLLRRLSQRNIDAASLLLKQALEVAARLPAHGMPLAELAAAVVGDSHALDPGHRLNAVVLRLIGHMTGFDAFINVEERRSAWASVGVLCDELSAPVLILNLRGSGSSATEKAMLLHAEKGEPYRLSTRQLLRERIDFSRSIPNNVVFICENPSIVAGVANRLGPRSAPLVSIEGQPKTAAHLLLTKLRDANVQLLYHGDFDWPGIQIGNLMRRRYGVQPWRFSACDYMSAPKRKRLHGRSSVADWDSHLATAMSKELLSVHEEAVMDVLTEDLCL